MASTRCRKASCQCKDQVVSDIQGDRSSLIVRIGISRNANGVLARRRDDDLVRTTGTRSTLGCDFWEVVCHVGRFDRPAASPDCQFPDRQPVRFGLCACQA